MGRLFEVVRWGNDSADPDDGGPNGPDTCFLVRAETPAEAAVLADAELRAAAASRVPPRADVVHLLGESSSSESEPRVVRGPYLEHAFNRGWRAWQREDGAIAWVEWVADAEPVAAADGGPKAGRRC